MFENKELRVARSTFVHSRDMNLSLDFDFWLLYLYRRSCCWGPALKSDYNNWWGPGSKTMSGIMHSTTLYLE
jgi:hypothetical protein